MPTLFVQQLQMQWYPLFPWGPTPQNSSCYFYPAINVLWVHWLQAYKTMRQVLCRHLGSMFLIYHNNI